jgi:hypothetical protein
MHPAAGRASPDDSLIADIAYARSRAAFCRVDEYPAGDDFLLSLAAADCGAAIAEADDCDYQYGSADESEHHVIPILDFAPGHLMRRKTRASILSLWWSGPFTVAKSWLPARASNDG